VRTDGKVLHADMYQDPLRDLPMKRVGRPGRPFCQMNLFHIGFRPIDAGPLGALAL